MDYQEYKKIASAMGYEPLDAEHWPLIEEVYMNFEKLKKEDVCMLSYDALKATQQLINCIALEHQPALEAYIKLYRCLRQKESDLEKALKETKNELESALYRCDTLTKANHDLNSRLQGIFDLSAPPSALHLLRTAKNYIGGY